MRNAGSSSRGTRGSLASSTRSGGSTGYQSGTKEASRGLAAAGEHGEAGVSPGEMAWPDAAASGPGARGTETPRTPEKSCHATPNHSFCRCERNGMGGNDILYSKDKHSVGDKNETSS